MVAAMNPLNPLNEFKFMLFGTALAALVLYAVGKKIGASIPQVIKDGAVAVGQLGKLGGNMVAHPLDTFGIAPAVNADGTQTWTQTTPWADPVYGAATPTVSSDPVANNDQGVNFNLF
jgi:hypothetical protein